MVQVDVFQLVVFGVNNFVLGLCFKKQLGAHRRMIGNVMDQGCFIWHPKDSHSTRWAQVGFGLK